jgi:nucleotide-binding universal stress UspA family protein
MRRIAVLLDGLHTRELIDGLDSSIGLSGSELVLVYVHGVGPRASLEMVRHRPGRGGMPSEREAQISEAERSRAADALLEAETLAAGRGAMSRRIEIEGEAGHAMCELAERERADLVVVRAGGRDTPPVGPRSLGPAARFIADHAPCPVLLMRVR